MTRLEAIKLAQKAVADRIGPWPLRFWEKVDIRSDDECWPWMAAFRRKDEKYGAFYLQGRHQPAHKAAWICVNGKVDKGWVVCHRCDNPPCCNPNHLFLGTPQDNDTDRVKKGRQCRGEKQKYAVLTDDKVRQIRSMKALGPTTVSRKLGIKYHLVWDVIHGRSWRHVQCPE